MWHLHALVHLTWRNLSTISYYYCTFCLPFCNSLCSMFFSKCNRLGMLATGFNASEQSIRPDIYSTTHWDPLGVNISKKGNHHLSMLTWCFTSKLPRDITVLQPRTRRSPRLLFRAGSAASTSSQQGRTTHGTRQRRETVPTMTNQGAGPWLQLGPPKSFAQVPNHLIPNLFIFNVMHRALERSTPKPSLSSCPSIHPPTLSAPSTLWTTEDTARKRKSYRQVWPAGQVGGNRSSRGK